MAELDQQIHPLVGAEHPQEDHHLAVARQPELGVEVAQALLRVALEGLQIHAVVHREDPRLVEVKHALERIADVGPHQHRVGLLDDPLLDEAGEPIGRAIGRDKAVVDHLAGQAALEVEHQRHAEGAGHRHGDPGALVQVGVDDVRAVAAGHLHRARHQQHIQVELVPRRPRRALAVPGDGRDAVGHDPANIVAEVVGDDLDIVAETQLRSRDLIDLHMAASV